MLNYRKVFKLLALSSVMKVKKITEIMGKKVFTDTGDYFGEVEESNLIDNKVDSWRIRVAGSIGSFLGGARGVIIPHQFVKSIGDVVIISRANLPLDEEEEIIEKTVDLSGSAGNQ
jgi:sporulation protein YlmC with PRC-barrel domain